MQNFFLVVSVFGLVLAISLFTRKSVNKLPAFFLGLFYIIFSIYTLQTYIIESGLLLKYTWFYVWPLPLYNLITVPIFFYFLILIKDKFVWRWLYLLVFIPFIIGVVDVINVYAKPQEFYDTIVSNAYLKPSERLKVTYGILNINQHYAMRFLWQILALINLLPILVDFVRSLMKEKDKKLLIWVVTLYSLFMLMSLLATMFALEKLVEVNFLRSSGSVLRTINLLFYVIVFAIGIMPIYFPSILLGYPRKDKQETNLRGLLDSNEVELKFGLNVIEISNGLEILSVKGLFYQNDFNLNNCAKALEIPPHHLSHFLNQHRGVSFAIFRNTVRIEHAKNLIASGFLDKSTIEALAAQCGFANRSSFSKIFKKITHKNITQFASEV